MALKQTPQWDFTLFPKTATAQRKVGAFAVVDLMADLMDGEPSTWTGAHPVNNLETFNDWGQVNGGFVLDNVGFARFKPNGEVVFNAEKGDKGPGGFFVLPRTLPRDPSGADLGPLAASGNEPWTVERGEFRVGSGLKTLGGRSLVNIGNDNAGSGGSLARTVNDWAQGKGIAVDLQFETIQNPATRRANASVRLGPELRLAAKQGLPWALERRVMTRAGMVATEGWTPWRQHVSGEIMDGRDTRYSHEIYALGGRLVWVLNGKGMWLTDDGRDGVAAGTQPAGTSGDTFFGVGDMARLLGGGKLEFQADLVRARMELFSREHGSGAGSGRTGTVTRRATLSNHARTRGPSLEPAAVGHQPVNTTMDATKGDGADVEYTVTLQADVDGLSSPFLTRFNLAYSPTWTTPAGDGIDITPCVTRATVSHAHPPVQAGSEGSITVDLKLMERLAPSALPYLTDYHGIEVRGKWIGTDGVAGAWDGVFKGEIWGISGDNPSFNTGVVTLTMRDKMARLRKPCAIVDGRCPPLDYLFMSRVTSAGKKPAMSGPPVGLTPGILADSWVFESIANDPELNYYGADAVKDVIAMFLGTAEAGRLNGTGNARRYLPASHPPFLSSLDMTGAWVPLATAFQQPLSSSAMGGQSSAIMMPPFRDDALSWINKIAADEYCLFTTGKPNRTQMWFDYMYGTREGILANAARGVISGEDAAYLLASAASYETRPENDINRVLVLCNPFGAQSSLAPAMVQGEARLKPSHPRSAESSGGERTLIVESALAISPARAKALALATLAEATDDVIRCPKYTLPFGDSRALVGDIYATGEEMILDGGLLDPRVVRFRSERVEHEYTVDAAGPAWTTNLHLRTMSERERQAYLATNPGPLP